MRRIALQDTIARQFDAVMRRVSKGRRGMGRSGMITIDCGQEEILERSAVSVDAQALR